MLLLASTADKINLVTATAVTVDVHASFTDFVSPSTVTPGNKNSAISTATTTEIVSSPASSTYRSVKTLHIKNKHATDSVLITVQHVNGTATVELLKVTLLAGELVCYVEGQGFKYIGADGLVKTNGAGSVYVKALAADQSNSTTTPTNVTGLEFPCGVGVWMFQYNIIHFSGATTTGLKFSVNHDGTVTSFVAYVRFGAGTTASSDAHNQNLVAAGAQIMSNFSARAKSTAGWGQTLSVDATGDMLTIIEGSLVVSVAGNIELWHGSEASAISTVKGGSSLMLVKTG